MGSQTSLKTSQRGGCNPSNSPPGSASVMLHSVSIVLTPLVTVYINACMEGCGKAHHRLLHRPANLSLESGKVPEREVPSQINPWAKPFFPTTPNTDVLVKTVLVRIKWGWTTIRRNQWNRDGNNLRTDLWESLLQATRLNFLWLTNKEIIGLKSKP